MKSELLGFIEKELSKCVDGLELYLGKGVVSRTRRSLGPGDSQRATSKENRT